MQNVLEHSVVTEPLVSEEQARAIVQDYVHDEIDATLSVVRDNQTNRPIAERKTWRFFIRCQEGPLRAIEVNARTGQVIPFSDSEIRVIREKAVILGARDQGNLPLDERGYVLGEYARHQAERYLSEQIGMYFCAVDPLFAAGEPAYWQITIVFQRYALGPFTLGVMDVNAKTGQAIPLTHPQIKRIRERTHGRRQDD